MKTVIIFLLVVLCGHNLFGQDKIRLLVRADDIGSFHAANHAVIKACEEGIATSAEIMVTCSWFPEAVKMLQERSNIDVGVHLVLTSEWTANKWRPLTHVPSLVDKDGCFYPMVWKNLNFPPNSSIEEAKWDMSEIEQELRAQIELAKKYLPHLSHISIHMGFTGLHPSIKELVSRLAREYQLPTGEGIEFISFPGWRGASSLEEKIDVFCRNIGQMTAGTYMFVEHPGYNVPEMQPVGHVGYENVAIDRDEVTKVLTSPQVKAAIKQKNVQLVNYKDLLNR